MTPKGLLLRAAIISLVYGLLHLIGGRESVGFLSGTPGGSVLLGCAYLVMHFLFVIVAPILAIASLLLALLLHLRSRHEVDTGIRQQ